MSSTVSRTTHPMHARRHGATLHAVPMLLGVLLLTPATHAAERYAGSAYARDDGQLLYREVHFLYRAQGEPRQLVLYQCPRGEVFARKLLHDSPDSTGPDFDFIDGRSGYREGVRRNSEGREIYVKKNADAPIRTKRLPSEPAAVIDAGFDTYVRMHWDALGKAAVTVPFLLPSRLGLVEIKLSDAADTQEHGTAVRHLSMRLDAWYGFALPPIELTYGMADRRLRRFEGIGTIRDSHGRNQNVRIEFPTEARQRDVLQADVDAALVEPLDGRCG